MSGVSNVASGAVGGFGLAVIASTMGCKAGAKRGGIVGGSVGLVGGAAVGVVGGSALLIGGAVTGAISVVKGVAAVPSSISAPRRGKWWNEATSTWVFTDLTTLQVPENDDDLLGGIGNDPEHGNTNANTNTHSGEVKDTQYYEALELETNANASKIKRQYYLMARKYHPDKNPGDPASAEKFKSAAEAYQVLSDPQLRFEYDHNGMDALSADKTSTNGNLDQQMDPSLLLAFLFGSDRFNSYIGRLVTSTSAMLGDTDKLSATDARILQERRCTRLAMTLVNRIQPWVDRNFEETEDVWTTQTEELKTASYGWELLQVIGMAYELTALQFLGSNDSGIGFRSVGKWAKGKKATSKLGFTKTKNAFQTLAAGLESAKVQSEYENKLEAAALDEEKTEQLKQERDNASIEIMMKIIWTNTSVDITSTIHETCQMVFFDQSVTKEIREMRAKAVQKLGTIFRASVAPPVDSDCHRKLFEDATLAATVETIKRKDEKADINAEEAATK